MRRREFNILISAAAAWPLVARAQKAMPVIGWIGNSSPSAGSWSVAAFLEGLAETGYFEGQNLAIEYRWSEDHYERLPAFADDLVRLKIDLMVMGGAAPSARAAKNATSTIPIVFTAVGDPVGAGLVASLARPGGNITPPQAKHLHPVRPLSPLSRVGWISCASAPAPGCGNQSGGKAPLGRVCPPLDQVAACVPRPNADCIRFAALSAPRAERAMATHAAICGGSIRCSLCGFPCYSCP